jgi:hypothetical protein
MTELETSFRLQVRTICMQLCLGPDRAAGPGQPVGMKRRGPPWPSSEEDLLSFVRGPLGRRLRSEGRDPDAVARDEIVRLKELNERSSGSLLPDTERLRKIVLVFS